MKTALAKLQKVQNELKAPKGQYNNFGKYKYRSNEDILEAVKPLLDNYRAVIIQSDSVTICGDRIYIEATSKFVCIETAEEIITTALARESLTKKGMDDSQISGTASSYARKYSLNGLLLIDDTKDADTQDNSPRQAQPKPTAMTLDQVKASITSCTTESQLGKLWQDHVGKTANANNAELVNLFKIQKAKITSG